MAKQKVLNTSFDLRYSCRDENHNTIRDFNLNFENADDTAVLTAVGLNIRASVVD